MDKASPYRAVAVPQRQRLSDSIAAQVEKLIVEGTLRPGESLPPERVLAQKFGVSRPSLREALLRLEARGLIGLVRGSGYAVTDVTAPILTDPLVHLLQHHPTAEQDVLELRHGIELVAAQGAALRATPADRKRLRERFGGIGKPRGKRDPVRDARADADFHLALAEASHNVALIHVMHGLHNLLRTSMRHAWELAHDEPDNARALHEQHAQMLDAVLAGDAERAREAAHLHLSYVRETLAQARGGSRLAATAVPRAVAQGRGARPRPVRSRAPRRRAAGR